MCECFHLLRQHSLSVDSGDSCAEIVRSALDLAIEDGKCWKEADDLLRLVYAAIDSLVSVWPCDCEWCSGVAATRRWLALCPLLPLPELSIRSIRPQT
jgi:hypothetical protein